MNLTTPDDHDGEYRMYMHDQHQHYTGNAVETGVTKVHRRPGFRRALPAASALLAVLTLAGTTAAAGSEVALAATTATDSGVRFDGKTYTNRLIDSPDPYLLLHAHNPVDWYPWGPEALARAKRENKPIFLSVGYSTCYWCHVAERLIYSKPEMAKLMNAWFVNIKVDREERPDLDTVYMLATQIMTGGGGWPNNLFLTPELKPFFAGSYFPPQDQGGRRGFATILTQLHQAWIDDRDHVLAVAERAHQALQQAERQMQAADEVAVAPAQWLVRAVQQSAAVFDAVNGGFSGGGATMFPQEPQLAMLLASYQANHDAKALEMLTQTLKAMAEGGVMDQLAGGFHRYSTEPSWSVPHFEKMLYDNAQLLGLYAQAWAITRQPLFKQVAQRTAHYLLTQMHADDGGFFSAEDAEVDGVEGASYVWRRERIDALLGAVDAERFFALYTLSPVPPSPAAGEREHESPGGVLRLDRAKAQALASKSHLARAIDALAPLRATLLAARNQRPQPARDEKIVLADNALVIIGLVQAGKALHDAALTQTASATADWAWRKAFDPHSGVLRHQFFHGHAGDGGLLDDYALLGQALLALKDATGESRWLSRARQIADAMRQRFERDDGSLANSTDTSSLLIAPPDMGDSVRPSGQSAALALLLRLAVETGDAQYAVAARRALAPVSARVAAQPDAWGALLAALGQPTLRTALERAPAPAGPGLPNSADFVHASAQSIAPASVQVAIDIDKGYHINANPASDPDLIPTQLMLDGDSSRLTVDYPQGQPFKAPFARQGIAVYSGRVVLHAALAPATPVPDGLTLRVQACNDKYCLAPANVDVPIAK